MTMKAMSGSSALAGDVYRRIPGTSKWELVLTSAGIPVVDSWKMPPRWCEDMARAPYVPGKTGAIFTGIRIS